MLKCILIPARGGSKSIPKKNLYHVNDKPLLYYVLDASSRSDIDDIWVSTEDIEIKRFALSFNVNVIDRPQHYAADLSTDLEVFKHFFENNQNYDYAIHLRATFPQINKDIINEACNMFEEHYNDIDSLRSVIRSTENPYKMWHIKNGFLKTVIKDNKLHSSPRQLIPESYIQNACIDIVKKDTIIEKKSMIGEKCLAFVMSNKFNCDIDTYEDLKNLENK